MTYPKEAPLAEFNHSRDSSFEKGELFEITDRYDRPDLANGGRYFRRISDGEFWGCLFSEITPLTPFAEEMLDLAKKGLL
jgi:hypothetical protein